jgi:serine phosphatase RsbU (regulator of sigma subunit)
MSVYLPQNNLKHQLMKKLILLILILMSGMIPTWAQSAAADDIEQLQKQMYQLYDKNDEAAFIDVTDRLKEAAEKAGDERTFYKAWANQALFFANHQQRNRGQLTAKDMQQYALTNDHKYGIYTGTHVMGTIQSMMGDYQEGAQNFKKAISYLHENFPNESAAASWIELARISLTNRNCQQACHDAEQALKEPNISARHRLNAWSVICLSKVDTVYYHAKNAEEYKKEFDYVWGEREKAKKAYGRDDSNGRILAVWRKLNDHQFEEALELNKQTSPLYQLGLRHLIYKRMGDYKMAYLEHLKYLRLRDSLNNKRNNHLLMEMTAALDLGRVELEAKKLKLHNQQMRLDMAADELAHKQLEEEALMLTLKNRDAELANATMQLENDSLEAHNKNLQLSEYQSKMQAQEQKEHTHHVMIGAAGAIALLVIAFLSFYLYRRQLSARRLQHAYHQLEDAYDKLEETTTAKERIESELRIARDIQMSMVPHTFPQRSDLDLYGLMTPAKEVGGDLYDFEIIDNQLYFCLGDVSGKGVPASLFMAQAIRLFRALAKQQRKPCDIATRLNNELSENNDNGMFVTMFIGEVDLTTGHLYYCNAGHNPPLLDGEFIEVQSNAPIGLWPELEFEGEELNSISGKLFFIYTDGLNEAENLAQEQYGDDRLQQMLKEMKSESAKHVIDTLRQTVESHRNGAAPNDDLTMLAIRCPVNCRMLGGPSFVGYQI